jgi:hypothetical protein
MERSCPTNPHPRRPRASARRAGFELGPLDGAARSTTVPAPIPTSPYLRCYAARPLSTSVSLAYRSGSLTPSPPCGSNDHRLIFLARIDDEVNEKR